MFHRQFYNNANARLTPNLTLQCYQNASVPKSQLEQDSNWFRNYSLIKFIFFIPMKDFIIFRWTFRFLKSREFLTYYCLTTITYQAIILVIIPIVIDITVQSVGCELHSYCAGEKHSIFKWYLRIHPCAAHKC
jgi:hypothetical protein